MTAKAPESTAIFGGSFNPPHCSHVMVVSWLLSCPGCTRVIVVPCFNHAFSKDLVPFDDRLAMCRLAFSIFGNAVEISDIEKALPSPSYTVNTVTALADMYPDRHLRLVIGSDIPAETDRWKEFDTIERLARPVVINRSGFPKHSEGPVFPEVSSTDIRHRLECGLDCRGLVPTGVLEYITRRGLYVDRGV